MNYSISYADPNTQYIPITATFEVDGKESVELQFPVWRPGRYQRADFVKNIHGFKVFDQDNKKVAFEKVSKDRWRVNCKEAKQLRVSYKYHAAELNAGSTYMDDQQLYVNQVNCLVYIKDMISDPCELQLDIPDNFEIACGKPFKDNRAQFKDYHELVDSPFIASASLQHQQFSCKDVTFHLWFQGNMKLDDKIIVDIERYTESQIEQFESFPVEEYHYLYQIQNIKAYHGVEHQHSTVISLGPAYDITDKLYDEFLGVSSHELYHTWNVKALRPLDWFPYDYSTENYSKLGYVAEGVTTYMGDLFLVESGVKDWEWYKKEFENFMQRHFDNFGRFNYSVAESSYDTWLDGYELGAPNRKVSIYNEGALLSFMLDMKIRTNSNNKASLHTVMKTLYERFAQEEKGYSEKDFQGVVEEFADENLQEFFEKYYYGTHAFETVLSKALEQAGLKIDMHHNKAWAARLLGIKAVAENGKTVVKRIYPGGSADLGGVMLNDEIIAVNDCKVDGDLNEWVAFFQEEQINLTINRMGRMVTIECPHTNKSFFPIYKIEKAKAPSNLQKRVFKNWSGTDWDEI